MPIIAAVIISVLILWIIRLRARVKHWRSAYLKMRACYRMESQRRKAAQATTKEALLRADGKALTERLHPQIEFEQAQHGPN